MKRRVIGKRIAISLCLLVCWFVPLLAQARKASDKPIPAPAATPVPPTATVPATTAGPATTTAQPSAEFRVGPGDMLRIDVWKEPEVSAAVMVRPDGFISLPLAKDLRVDGLTAMEIQKLITDRLNQFLTSPDVTVVVQQINSKKIYLVGEVRRVGPIALLSPMTVAQALSEAGGPTEYANTKQILILRTQKGRTSRFQFNYKDFLKGEAQDQNIALLAGDTIVVR